MALTEMSIIWLPLVMIALILSAVFTYFYFKDKDKRKLMLAIALSLSMISYVSYFFNVRFLEMQSQLLQNLIFWSTYQLLICFLIVVNEQFVKKKDFEILFRLYIILIISSFIILSFLPIRITNNITSIIFALISIEIISVLIYLLIRFKNPADLLFLCSISCFAVAGISMRNFELIYLSIFSFIVGYLFLFLVFTVSSNIKDKQGIGAYFSLQQKLKTTEKALQESEEKVKSVLENIPDFIMNIDCDGNILYTNQRKIEKDKKNNFYENLNDYIDSKYQGKNEQLFTHVLKYGNEISYEAPGKLPDGKDAWFLIRFSPIKRDDEIISVMRIVTDITDKRKIENELKKRLKDLEDTETATLNIMEDMQETVNNLKKAEEEILNKNKELQIKTENIELTNKELMKTREELVILNRDLESKVKKRTAEIEKLLKQKDEFIGQLGHDLKTPLTPLNTLLPMIAEKIDNPNLKEMMQVNINNVKYMKNLVSKTLQLARLNSPIYKLDLKKTNLALVISKVIDKKAMILNENDIAIYHNIDKDLFIKADLLEIEELLNNLISNAVKYTDGAGVVKIDAKDQNNGFIKVSIKDSGIGMTKDEKKHIFDEFYKTDMSRHDLDSHGLGLSICKRVVEKHGGKIWAESPGIGKGSTFYFTVKSANKKHN